MAKKKGLFSWFKKSEETADSKIETEAQVPDRGNDASDEQLQQHVEQENQDAGIQESEAAEVSSVTPQDESQVSEQKEDSELDLESEQVQQAEQEKFDTEEQSIPEDDNRAPAGESQKLGFFQRLKSGLTKTRQNIGSGLFDLFRDKKIDDELFEELETQLLLADVGVETTTKIIDSLTQAASRSQLKDAEALYELLKQELHQVLDGVTSTEEPAVSGPRVILMVGVNGVGKTTTIGKLAKQFQAQGKSVMLAAGDTFRAAAVEQLQVWGERNDIQVVAQHTGADSASVIFDALNSAKSKNVDILIADTAGRLQNKAHLMEELKKVVRVMKKIDADAPHEIMLTIDAGTGQNAISQTQLFDDAVGLTSLAVTKLDGTAKGGVIFAVADKFKIPIKYLGVGEGIDDLRQFDAKDFIEALFEK
ncbi:signal recognition particle-docking protein FtsY [Thalassotalea mangrovi]|uniref:Signal recognition particle receptor FtsY n=1 Tax=Thalassotalea mangrovi TaxID=2572245 RepID=A0A4U1B5L9_9GAMM|nr:signal recognition particle-docking protein FtsY [Thalassotalea mangrovi]TKB45408.1 signal recognition particle-docking protein FtsY [Thalassotalea mangrovi]